MSATVSERGSAVRLFERPSTERADALVERIEAVETALAQGVPLHQIEADLDWLDALQGGSQMPRIAIERGTQSHTARG